MPAQSSFSFRQRLLLTVIPRLAALLIRTLGATWRYENVFPADAVNPIPGDQIPGPTIYAFWHRSLLACAYRFRHRQIAILISRSFDGELIARTVERLGFKAVRGSSSRGGAAALRGMADAYAAGHSCAITADGPRGPNMVAKPGTAQLAHLVRSPWVGTFNAVPLNAWELKTWDRFLIPKPFSKILVIFPHPFPTDTPNLQQAIQQSLDASISMGRHAKRAVQVAPPVSP